MILQHTVGTVPKHIIFYTGSYIFQHSAVELHAVWVEASDGISRTWAETSGATTPSWAENFSPKSTTWSETT